MKNVTSILLTVLLLMSSAGVTYGQHYCGGKVVADALMLGEKHLSCGGYELPVKDTNGMEKSGCCENKYHQVVTDDDFFSSTFAIEFQKTFLAAFVPVFILQEPIAYSSKINSFSEYLPPPLEKDIPVLYQTFLI